MSKSTPKITVLESPDLVAFIAVHQGIQPRPFLRKSDRKIVFEFTGDIRPSIDAFYRNVPVPVSDFCMNLKRIRSMIFTLRTEA